MTEFANLETGGRLVTNLHTPVPLALTLPVGPLHGAVPSTPVPHWVVLLVVVPALWLVIGATVVGVDLLLRRFGV